MSLNLTRCPTPEELAKNQQITIFAVGLPDNIVVNLEPFCRCECELSSQVVCILVKITIKKCHCPLHNEGCIN